MSYMYLFKYIIIGDTGCGKSCILNQFVEKQFNPDHDITIGVDFGTNIITSKDGKKIKIQVWDTAGHERFISITRSYYRGSAVAIIVFDLTRLDTFINIKKWFDEITKTCHKKTVIILVGNKCDLTHKRQVSEEIARNLADEYGCLYIEVSAKTSYKVESIFRITMEQVLDNMEKGFVTPSDEKGIKECSLETIETYPSSTCCRLM